MHLCHTGMQHRIAVASLFTMRMLPCSSSAAVLQGKKAEALMKAAKLTRFEATLALSRASWNLEAAYKNELSSYPVHVSLLDPLLQEYMKFRCARTFHL